MKVLTAHEFAGMEDLRFGIDSRRTVSMLRALADEMEKVDPSGKLSVLPQEVICYTEASIEEYVMCTLVIKYVQRLKE